MSCLVIVGGEEEPRPGRVREVLQHRVGEFCGGAQPLRLEGRLVERHEGVSEEGVVFEVAVELRRGVGRAGAEQPAVLYRAGA